MPLAADPKQVYAENVFFITFVMMDDDKIVPCSVSRAVLKHKLREGDENEVETFARCRKAIEDAASNSYYAGGIAEDGRVQLTMFDFP